MARITEKRLYAVSPQNFTSDGTANGQLTVADTRLFCVGQVIKLLSDTQQPYLLKIKRIPNLHTILVGLPTKPIQDRADISAYTVVDNATIAAAEQERPSVPEQEIERLTYAEEPAVARRVIPVNPFGEFVNQSEDGIVPQEFDDVILTRDIDGDVTDAKFYFAGALIADLELTYDLNKDVIRVRKI